MWTFDDPPLAALHKEHGFTPSAAWLEHLRLASVRFNDGGSGSVVSPNGLVITNHHVAVGQLQKLSSPRKDDLADGFFASSSVNELKCPDLELNVLMSSENVTARRPAARGARERSGAGWCAVPEGALSISIGVASRSLDRRWRPSDAVTNDEESERLFRAADRALYAAKNGGRDRVSTAPPPSAAAHRQRSTPIR